MVFNSIEFAIFFVVVYAAYRLLPHRQQNWLLLAASYWFYAAWDWRFLGLLIGTTLVDYAVALALERQSSQSQRRQLVAVSVIFNLGVLGFFKYYAFFVDSLHGLLRAGGFDFSLPMLRVVLPIGISFYTFMSMGYVIDVYRREIPATRSLLDFAVFVAYFPHLVAGPILRASALIPQIAAPRHIAPAQIAEGGWLIGWGLVKKVLVADNLGPVVDAIFADPSPSAIDVLVGSYAFAFQIYGDFSGYTDIARGVSKWMGIELNLNFLFPYFVRSPQAFWRHWHISLSTWLRDYLYIPLGGNRGTRAQTYRNLMITMVLGGLWHGAAWPFVVWGVYQGGLLVIYRWAGERIAGTRWRAALDHPAVVLAGWALMFHLTCYGWLIFRSPDMATIVRMTGALAAGWAPGPYSVQYALQLLFYAGPLALLHGLEAWRRDLLTVPRLPVVPRYAIYVALTYLTLLFGQFSGTQFIYFQF